MFDTAIETAYTVSTATAVDFRRGQSNHSEEVPVIPTVLFSHSALKRWHVRARYVVLAQHKRHNEFMICDVVIPAGVEPSFHRRCVERTIQEHFPMFHVPSRGEKPWYLHDLSEACPF